MVGRRNAGRSGGGRRPARLESQGRRRDGSRGLGLAADIQFGYTARPREGNLLLGQPVTWLGWPSSSVGRAED